jgi:hypothetical protein
VIAETGISKKSPILRVTDSMEADSELITIVEGPPPEFKSASEVWVLSLIEASRPYHVSLCQVRSFNGRMLLGRCQRAWRKGRPIRLDFPTMSGLRRQLEIVAARYEQLPEGDMLNLWVRHQPDDLENVAPRGDSDAP